MAEVRKFDPSQGEGLQKLVREAIGETVRPIEPGAQPAQATRDAEEPAVSAADLPVIDGYFSFDVPQP